MFKHSAGKSATTIFVLQNPRVSIFQNKTKQNKNTNVSVTKIFKIIINK